MNIKIATAIRPTFTFLLCLTFTLATAYAEDAKEVAEGKHLFILSGQSNMRSPLPETFKEVVANVFGKDKVIVVTVAHPSQSIMRWSKNWAPPEGAAPVDGKGIGTLYDALMINVNRAIMGKDLASVTFIWMQGEADAERGWGAVYEKSFYAVLDQFKSDLKRKEINYVIGRINDYWLTSKGIKDGDLVRELQAKMGKAHPNGGWVDTDDLNAGVNPWGTYEFAGGHFPNPGYRVMGQRFARQACRLIDPKMKLDEALFAEAFPDDARKMKSHLALDKPISGTQPDPAHSGGKSGLAALVDGKLGSPVPSDPAWLAFPPTEKNIGFIIDLGKPTDISSVAINLLVNHDATAHLPSKIDVSISENGIDYKHLLSGRSNSVSFEKLTRQQNLSRDFTPQAILVFIEKSALAVRYVKIEIVPDAASNSWFFLDEIMINPLTK